MRITVLEKVYGPYRPEDFTPAFLSLCQGLEVDVRVVGTAGRGWLVVEVEGEDEEVALRLLEEEMGLAPARLDALGRFSTIRGRVLAVREDGLLVDIGVFEPFNLDALVPAGVLRAQLADGLDIGVEELASLFCLMEGLPLEVKLLEGPGGVEGRPVPAMLSEAQVRALEAWVLSGLDRVVVTCASHHVVRRAIRGPGLHRLVVDIERLGLLENCVVLKLGAPASDIIRSIRRRSADARTCVFRPGRIMSRFPGRFTRSAF